MKNRKLKLHLGCGNNILEGWHNIDLYIKNNLKVRNYDITKKLPHEDGEVDEILCSHVIEHLNFFQEKLFFDEVYRLLNKNGKLTIEVYDGEWVVKKWLEANDNWKQFYINKDHDYFGNGYNINERWGVLTAHLFGNAGHEGQFHHNIYTEKKLYRIAEYYNYKNIFVDKYNYDKFKELQCLRLKAIK